jgi:hypothetical protein
MSSPSQERRVSTVWISAIGAFDATFLALVCIVTTASSMRTHGHSFVRMLAWQLHSLERLGNRVDRSRGLLRTAAFEAGAAHGTRGAVVTGGASRPSGISTVHRAAIVNVAEVQEVTDDAALTLRLSDGSRVDVSRSRRRHVEPMVLPRLRSAKSSQ